MSTHLIHEVDFNASFNSIDSAKEFEEQLKTSISQRLLTEIDDVFNQLDLMGHQVCIDELEINLGAHNFDGNMDTLVANMARSLRESLTEKMKSIRQAVSVGVNREKSITLNTAELKGITFKSQTQVQWHRLQCFLEYGVIPINDVKDESLEKLLPKLIDDHFTEFMNWLSEVPQPSRIFMRLLNQLDDLSLQRLIKRIHNQPALIPAKVHRILLNQNLVNTINAKMPKTKAFRSLYLDYSITQAIVEMKMPWLQLNWPELIANSGEVFSHLLRELGKLEPIRKNMAYQFSQSQLGDILLLLEPLEHEFVQSLLKHNNWELIIKAKSHLNLADKRSSQVRMNPSKLKANLWFYTLTYLLIERGSQFNRKSYLHSLLKQMAANMNVAIHQLRDAFLQNLQSMSTNSSLKLSIFEMLDSPFLSPSTLRADEPVPSYLSSEIKITAALLDPRLKLGSLSWSAVLQEKGPLLVQLLRVYGTQYKVRKSLVDNFSEPQLKQLLTLLEPNNYEFISQWIGLSWSLTSILINTADKKITLDGQSLSKQLWLFTLQFLLVERRNVFNQENYLTSVLSQLASFYNQSLTTLLNALSPVISSLSINSALLQALNSLIEKHPSEDLEPLSHQTVDKDDRVISLFMAALYGGAESMLAPQWRQINTLHGPLVKTLLGRHGLKRAVRQHLSQQFSDEFLLDIVDLLAPQGHECIASLLSQKHHFKQALQEPIMMISPVSDQELRQQFWLFSLNYLLVERGGHFNKKSYLHSIIRQQASSHGLNVAQLVTALNHVFNSASDHSNFVKSLQGILNELQADCLPAPAALLGDHLALRHSPVNTQRIFAKVKQALDRGEHANLNRLLSALSESAPQGLHNWLIEQGSQGRARQHLSEYLSSANLQAVLHLLAPEHHESINAIIKKPPPFELALGKCGAVKPLAQVTHVQLVYFSLTFLLVDRGTRFNQQDYMASIIRQMAAHYNVSAKALLVALQEHFSQQLTAPSSLRQHSKWQWQVIGQLLNTLSPPESNIENAPVLTKPTLSLPVVQPADATSKNLPKTLEAASLDKQYFSYGVLQLALTGGGAIGHDIKNYDANAFNDALLVLAKGAPQLLLRLWRQMQHALRDNEVTAVLRLESLPASQLGGLLNCFLNLPVLGTRPPRQLINSINQWLSTLAQAEKNQAYQLLFIQLLNEKPIDLEQLNTRVQLSTHPTRPVPKGQSLQPAQECRSPRTEIANPQAGAAALFHQLCEVVSAKSASTPTQQLKLFNALQKYHQHNSHELQQQNFHDLFKNSFDNQQSLTRLLNTLPENVLASVLLQQLGGALLQLMPSLEWLCNGAQSQLSVKALFRLKYRFIWQYLVVEKRPVNHQTLVAQFLKLWWASSQSTRWSEFCEHYAKPFQQKLMANVPVGNQSLLKVLAQQVSLQISQNSPGVLLLNTPSSEKNNDHDSQNTNSQSVEESHQSPSPTLSLEGEIIAIENAGLVLANPYLPMLFERLAWLEAGKFKDNATAERAVYLLQYLVGGQQSTQEQWLPLNKLLCGVALDQPISGGVELTQAEKDMSHGLINSMLSHWGAIPNTSVNGFQETFLQRNGHLRLEDDTWQLRVQYKSYDIIRTVKPVPWNTSLIKYQWMTQPVYVTWDNTTEHL